MGRIGAHLSGAELALLNRLADASAAATLNSLRIAAGRRILQPSDAPATYFALSALGAQLSDVTALMGNVTAAGSLITQAQTVIDQITAQLQDIRTELLLDEHGGLTAEQRAEAQAKIDSAIGQIAQLVATDVGGRQLFDGSAHYSVSGRNGNQVTDLWVHNVPSEGSVTISGSVTTAATRAQLVYTGSGGQTTAAATFTLSGNRGSVSIAVAASEDLDDVADRINAESHNTGITAAVEGDKLTLSSVDYGTAAKLAVSVTSGTFNVTGGNGDGTANGTNAVAAINGLSAGDAGITINGNCVTVNQNGFHFEMELAEGFTGTLDTITVSGGALSFAFHSNPARRAALSLPSLLTGRLGGLSGTLGQLGSGGSLSGLAGNTSQAIRVVDEALALVARVGGAVDGFYSAAVSSTSSLLSQMQEDLEGAISNLDGYDENKESLLLSKNQQLATNAAAGLAILNQQRQSIVALLRQIAGLI